MFQGLAGRISDYTIRCKGCGENLAASIETMPDSWIVALGPI